MTESEDGALLSRIRAAVAGETGIPNDLAPAFSLADSIPDIRVFQQACRALPSGPQWLRDAAEFLHSVDMCLCPVVRAARSHWDTIQTLFVYAIFKTDTDDMMMMEGGGGDEAEPDPHQTTFAEQAERLRAEARAARRADGEARMRQPLGELARSAAGLA